MKQEKAIKAYKAIESLTKQSLPIKTSYRLYKIYNELKKCYDFQVAEERKIFSDYEQYYDKKTNNFVFDSNDKARSEELLARIKEINDIDVEEEFEPVRIDPETDIQLSVEQIEALDGIIEFE